MALENKYYEYIFYFNYACNQGILKGTKILGPFLILLATGLVVSISLSLCFVIFPTLAPFGTIVWWMHFFLLVLLNYCIFFHYRKCISTDPGDCLFNQEKNTMQDALMLNSQAEKTWSFCRKCRKSRPPRAHHCIVCQKCILQMDHHCPWINNCVGYNNYKYFVGFLFWLCIGAMYVSLASFSSFMKAITQKTPSRMLNFFFFNKIFSQDQLVISLFSLSVTILLTVGALFCWHLYLILTAQTTIEFYINRRRKVKQTKSEYDQGIDLNWNKVFGKNRFKIMGFLPLPKKDPDSYENTIEQV